LILESLRLQGWRNLEPTAFEPGRRATVLFGENGQGKTNLLEAAHYALEFRSFRAKTSDELVAWGAPRAQLAAQVSVGGLERRIDVEVGGGRKVARVDGKAARRDAESLRGVGVVLFVPEDLLLPKGPPAQRRSFVDRAAFGVERVYYAEALAFQKVLKSRNALLRRGDARAALLATYDEELARTGARVVLRRRRLVTALVPRAERLFREIHGELGLRMRYRSQPIVEAAETELDVAEALLAGLSGCRERDLRRGFSGFGPQTDDLEIELLGHPVREHASQGQLRSLVLSLKLAELETLHDAVGEPPLLLFDDVGSELDEQRRGKLFETIDRLGGQTFITLTDPDLLPPLGGRVDFLVKGGRLSRV
jgi:DNA replication and repair protein RecF